MSETRIHPDEMPAPDALINYSGGSVGPAMFHYLPTETSSDDIFRQTAREHEFEVRGARMRDDHPLYAEYEDGASDIILKWQPEVPEGWQFGGKHDTEDGPYAYFLRRIK